MKKVVKYILALNIAVIISLLSFVCSASTPPIVRIESPNNSFVRNSVTIKGWAINNNGVKNVAIYINNKKVGYATAGLKRYDVQKVYKNYNHSLYSGYTYTLNTSSYAAGKYTVKAVATGKDGKVVTATAYFTRITTNVHIDYPKTGTKVTSDFTVNGWAISPNGVNNVSILIDGKTVGTTTTGLSRTDVKTYFCNSYKGDYFKNADKSGYNYKVNIDTLSKGTHKLTVKATDSVTGESASVDSTFTVTKAAPDSRIDIPKDNNEYLTDTLTVEGWSVHASGVKSVQVYLDGKFKGYANIGLSRPDVDQKINKNNQYKDALHSGYSLTLTGLYNYKPGQHTVKIISTGNDGEVCTFERPVTKVAPDSRIDTPKDNNEYLTDTLTVEGWSANACGVKSVQVYLDGKFKGYANIGLPRQDVDQKINKNNQYKDALHSGYSLTLTGLYNYKPGQHTVKIISTGNDGEVCTFERPVTKVAPDSRIDTPKDNNEYLTDTLTVKGWSANACGVKSVQVYLDGKFKGYANIGLPRPDVNEKMNKNNQYKDAHRSGYSLTLTGLYNYKPGQHTVKIVSTGNDGEVCTFERPVTKAAPDSRIDTPKDNNEYLTNTLTVEGWSVHASGVKSVQVYLDGKFQGNANIGRSRPDVNEKINKNNKYKDAHRSGYSLTLTGLYNYKPGQHTVKIVSTGNDGEVCTFQRNVTKSSPMIRFDSNTPSTITKNTTITGWSANATGIKKVELYCDSTLICTSTTPSASPDVVKVYDNNSAKKFANSSNCRYSFDINIDSIKRGSHTFTLKSTGNDGETVSISKTIKIEKPASLGYIDNPKNGSVYTYIDTDIKIKGWSLDASGVKKVRVFIDNTEEPVLYGLASDNGIIELADGNYKNADNARFSTDPIDISKLSYGKHTVKVMSYGNDGEVYTFSTSFLKSNTTYTSYNITLNEMSKEHNGISKNALDPNSIINADAYGIYEFMTLNYIDGITASQMNNMLKDCGVLEGKGQVFINAGKKYNLNPVYLAAHAIHETGKGTSKLSKGVNVNSGTYIFKNDNNRRITVPVSGKYYNQFGIKACDSDAVNEGAAYAGSKGWNSVDASIMGGAEWIAKNFVWGGKPNQDTLYEMRWDPDYWTGKYKNKYEYATDTNWAHKIAYYIYLNKDIFNGKQLTFDIPKYK